MIKKQKWEEHTFLLVSTIRLLAEMDKQTATHVFRVADMLRMIYQKGGNLDDKQIMEEYLSE